MGDSMSISYYTPPPRPADESAREAAVRRSGAIGLPNHPVLSAIVSQVCRQFHASTCAVTIVYEEWQYVIVGHGIDIGPYSRRTSFCGHAILEPTEVFCIADASHDPRFAGNPLTESEGGVQFYAGAPILYDGQPIGVLCVTDETARPALTSEERRHLDRCARAVGTAIDQAGAGQSDPLFS